MSSLRAFRPFFTSALDHPSASPALWQPPSSLFDNFSAATTAGFPPVSIEEKENGYESESRYLLLFATFDELKTTDEADRLPFPLLLSLALQSSLSSLESKFVFLVLLTSIALADLVPPLFLLLVQKEELKVSLGDQNRRLILEGNMVRKESPSGNIKEVSGEGKAEQEGTVAQNNGEKGESTGRRRHQLVFFSSFLSPSDPDLFSLSPYLLSLLGLLKSVGKNFLVDERVFRQSFHRAFHFAT